MNTLQLTFLLCLYEAEDRNTPYSGWEIYVHKCLVWEMFVICPAKVHDNWDE